MAVRYTLRSMPDVDHNIDYEVSEDIDKPEPFVVKNWNKAKLGPMKTIAEYRTISETPEFKVWYRVWYRQRKLDHGNTTEQADAKVSRVFDR